MISDEEHISDTDSEPSSPRQAPRVEKRQYHNLLERNRRNILKTSFYRLRCVIPSLAKKKSMTNSKKVSRAKILKRAIKLIKREERKRPARLRDIRELEKDNAQLEEYCKTLQKMEETGDLSNVESIFESIDEINRKVYDSEPDTEDDDDDTGDDDDDTEDDEDVDVTNDPDSEGSGDPRLEWSSENECEINDPEQDWSVNVSEESESSNSDDTMADSSSEEDSSPEDNE